jgi:IS5 family transposase
MKRRAAGEPVIGATISKAASATASTVLAAAGYNFGLLQRWLAELLRAIIRAFAETRLKRIA